MNGITVVLFLSEGRFHLEAEMISNLSLRELCYDLYGKILMDEWYNTKAIYMIRRGSIEAAISSNSRCALIQGGI